MASWFFCRSGISCLPGTAVYRSVHLLIIVDKAANHYSHVCADWGRHITITKGKQVQTEEYNSGIQIFSFFFLDNEVIH